MMIVKILKWLLVILALKVFVAAVVSRFYTDPRRDITARMQHCAAFRPNVVFIGTSRTLYGIDPALFDSLNHQRNRSYNFGIFSLSPYSAIRIADELLATSTSVRTIYLELSALDYSTVALPPTEVVQDAMFRARMLHAHPDIPVQEKTSSFLNGLNTTMFQMVSITPQVLSIKKAINTGTDPIEGKADLLANGHQCVSAALAEPNERIRSNAAATGQTLSASSTGTPNAYYITQIKALASRARQQGKRVVFYFPNNITEGERRILSHVAPFLPADVLVRPPLEPAMNALFNPENLFDAHHLNQQGAAIYTRLLQQSLP